MNANAPLPATELSDAERSYLRHLVETLGEHVVVERLGTTRHAIARLIAGLPARRGTVLLARIALARIDNDNDNV